MVRRYSKRAEDLFSVIEGTPIYMGKLATKTDAEKIIYLKDVLSETQFQRVVDALFAGKVSLTKVHRNISSKINNREVSPAGLLLKKLTRSNKALSKLLEEYDDSMFVPYTEEALVVAFSESLVTLFFRFGDILEALGNPQDRVIEETDDDEEEEE